MSHQYATLIALLTIAAACVNEAAATAAPHGAYLGCFDITQAPQVQSLSKSTFQDCAPSCAERNYALAMVGTDYECSCSSVVPAASLELPYTECLPGKKGVAVFYQHKDANSTLCRVSNLPMSPKTWGTAYGKENFKFGTDPENTLTVKLDSTVGSRLETQDGEYLYGMFQISAKISGAPGVVSAFYTRSSRVYPNDIVADFSEIDWEWCNAKPCEPYSIWLNSLTKAKSNGERLVPPAEYQKKLNTKLRTDNSWITYTINWQPDFVAWFANDSLIQIHRNGQEITWTDMGGKLNTRTYQAPNLASHQTISVWTDDRDVPEQFRFGGTIDLSKGPYHSYFKNLRRVVCDEPLPTKPDAALLAMGPAWLYGRNETVTAEDVPVVLATFRRNATLEMLEELNSGVAVDRDDPSWVGLGALGVGGAGGDSARRISSATAVAAVAGWTSVLALAVSAVTLSLL